MRRLFVGWKRALLCGLLLVAGCAPKAEVVVTEGPTISEAQAEPATGEKLRVAVMDFKNKTRYDVGRGMQSMLTSALFHSNKFLMVERGELRDVLVEQRLGATGVVSRETAVPTGEIEGAEILIIGEVTEFEPGTQGVRTVVGGVQQAHVAIDIRLVDARTSRVLASTTVQGKATDVQLSTEMLKYVGMSPVYYLDAWSDTPVESAIRLCIDRAVDYIVTKLE